MSDTITTTTVHDVARRRQDQALRTIHATDPRVPLDETQLQKLEPFLREQLLTARLAVPTLDLFPTPTTMGEITDSMSGKGREGHYDRDHVAVIGISDYNKMFNITELLQNILPYRKDDKSCASNRMADGKFPIRVFAALHEIAHYVGDALKLDDAVYRAMIRGDPSQDISSIEKGTHGLTNLEINAQERLADTTASLYMLSNYKMPTDGNDVVNIFQNYRQMGYESAHRTTSSIMFAQKDFVEHPRYGLSIVECAKWAAEIISQQPGLVQEFLQSKNLFDKALDPPSTMNATTTPDAREVKARDRLCTPEPAKQLVQPLESHLSP